MKALIDTNVIVDVLTRREPFFSLSAQVLSKAEKGIFTAWIGATTVTTIFYLVRRQLGSEETIKRIQTLTSICNIAQVNQSVIDYALQSPFSDFEDAVLNHAAINVGAECIITRNEADFKHSNLLIYSPAQFLATIA